MKKILSGLIAFIAMTTVSAQEVIHDANAEVRKVSGFSAIEVFGAIDVRLSQSDEDAVAVSAATPEYRDKIRSEVKEGVLTLWFEDKRTFRAADKQLKAYLSFKNIDRISASGACDVNVSGKMKAPKLAVRLSGASDFRGEVESGSMTFEMSGASDVKINGLATDIDIKASGASEFKGFQLVVENCTVHASGASDVRITVNKELNAFASGATGIYYKGTGLIKDIKSSGASNISRED